MVIGVTDEGPELVDEWVRKYKPAYPVVSLRNGDFEDALGVKFFPTAAVIAPTGELTYAGSAGSVGGYIKKSLKKTKASLWPKALKSARAAYWQGDFGKSYAALVKVVDKGKLEGAEAERAQALKAWMEADAERRVADARKMLEEGFVYRAMTSLESIDGGKTPLPCQDDCAALVAEIKGLDQYRKEMKGGELYEEITAKEKVNLKKAAEEYTELAEKYEGTRIAKCAKRRALELQQDPRAH